MGNIDDCILFLESLSTGIGSVVQGKRTVLKINTQEYSLDIYIYIKRQEMFSDRLITIEEYSSIYYHLFSHFVL